MKEIPVATIGEALCQMQDFGLNINHCDVDTHTVRRCRWGQKRANDGFYRLWSVIGSNLVTGFFGKFSHGYEVHKITSTREAPELNDAQRHQMIRRMEESKVQIEKDFKPDLQIWEEAEPCQSHPYLEKKKVSSYGLRQIMGTNGMELLVPMFSNDEELVGIQRIFADGKKLMVKGSSKKSSYHKIEGSDVVAICEGYATAATVHEATGWTSIVAFDCGNLRAVARFFRTKKLIICADNDNKTDGNPGVTKAKEIAKVYFCPVGIPKQDGSDFNDVGVEEAAKTLLPLEPKSFIEQLAEISDGKDKTNLERFILDRREYLAQYPKAEFAFLKNRINETFGITKGFLDDAIQGIKSDEQKQIIEDARAELETVRYDGKHYHKLKLSPEGDRYYSTTQQEITLLVGMASDDSSEEKQRYLDEIHRLKVVGEVSAQSMISGRSHIKEFLGPDGTLLIKKMVSTEKCIESRLVELDDVEIDEGFINYINEEYPEVIDVIEASLARKFCESKKAFVYFKCPTSYGKTFFFGPESLSRTFTKRYKVDEFRGNSPDDFLKPLFLFIDEADCFPSEYKVNEPEYKRLYGGIARVKLGLRVMASANGIEDLERGIDPQIRERVVYITPEPKRLNHQGIEKGRSQKMWEKWILNRLANKLMDWAATDDAMKRCEEHFNAFCEKYSQHQAQPMDLEQVAIEHIVDLLGMNWKRPISGVNFSDFIERDNDFYFITSPKKFFKELFKVFDEERWKAFSSQFKTREDWGGMLHFKYFEAYRIGNKTKRGLFFATNKTTDSFEVAKLSATLQKN